MTIKKGYPKKSRTAQHSFQGRQNNTTVDLREGENIDTKRDWTEIEESRDLEPRKAVEKGKPQIEKL